MAISIPFLVDMPKVAVVPVNEPNSPIRISLADWSGCVLPHDVNASVTDKHKNKKRDTCFMVSFLELCIRSRTYCTAIPAMNKAQDYSTFAFT
jgi:hypothetical protein